MPTRIYVAGHQGMVGSAIVRQLQDRSDVTLITRTRQELDLLDQAAVYAFLKDQKPDQIYLAAAKVGGIHANNTYPAEFIHQNLVIQNNVIHGAYLAGVQKLLFLGSSCIYPKHAPQPMKEEYLLTGPLEPTNEPYAIAKIAGIKMCESYNREYGTDYRSVMPTNLYGPNDNFHPENSHVLPALLRRFHEAKLANAKEVVVWGTGNVRREFMHVDDMASASVHVMELTKSRWQAAVKPDCSHVNVGTGVDCSIRELAELILQVVGLDATLRFDSSKPDGTPRKLLNVQLLLRLDWQPRLTLKHGLNDTYAWLLANTGIPLRQ